MKKAFAILICLSSFWQVSYSQNSPDGIGFIVSADLGIQPMHLSGQWDVDNISSANVYVYTDTLSIVGYAMGRFGINIPVYKTRNWSAGVKLNCGIGMQGGLKAADGIAGFMTDFPQYAYYRNYSTPLDFSVKMGYKYTRGAIHNHLIMAGVEFNVNEEVSIGFYSSLFKYKYYTYFTNGELKPSIKISEFGISFTSTSYHWN